MLFSFFSVIFDLIMVLVSPLFCTQGKAIRLVDFIAEIKKVFSHTNHHRKKKALSPELGLSDCTISVAFICAEFVL